MRIVWGRVDDRLDLGIGQHRLVARGWTAAVFFREFVALYLGACVTAYNVELARALDGVGQNARPPSDPDAAHAERIGAHDDFNPLRSNRQPPWRCSIRSYQESGFGKDWMDCAPACRGHQAAFLGPATPFGISRSRSAGRRGNRNLRRPIVALDHSWISPSTIWMAGELAGFWCHIKGESIENAWIRPIEHVVVFAGSGAQERWKDA